MISFVVGLASVFTGLCFTVIITRQLSQEEFGIWSLIGGLAAYVLIFRPIISFWSTREIARGVESGKTSFLSNSFFASAATIIYLIIVYFYSEHTDVNLNILFFSSILIPVEFVRSSLIGITNAFKPQTEEYGIIIFEIIKIVTAIILIYFLDMGIVGLIITSVIATLSTILWLLIRTFPKIKGEFHKKYLKKWLKLFWLPTYPNISQLLNTIDVTVFTIVTGSVTGLAYWGVARAVGRIVNHSTKIGKAVYPKLLGGGKKEYFQENLTLVFYFSFPLAAMSFTFAKPGLFVLNPIYEVAIFIVVFLVPTILFRTLADLFSEILSGIEKVDTRINATFMDYLKSKLFFLPTLRNIQSTVYLTSLGVMLFFTINITDSDLDLVLYWSIIALVTQIPYTFYLFLLIRREFKPKIDTKAIAKYFFASVIAFGITYLLMEKYLNYKESLFEFLPEFLPFVGIGSISYLVITYFIDSKTKNLFKSILKEINNKSV